MSFTNALFIFCHCLTHSLNVVLLLIFFGWSASSEAEDPILVGPPSSSKVGTPSILTSRVLKQIINVPSTGRMSFPTILRESLDVLLSSVRAENDNLIFGIRVISSVCDGHTVIKAHLLMSPPIADSSNKYMQSTGRAIETSVSKCLHENSPAAIAEGDQSSCKGAYFKRELADKIGHFISKACDASFITKIWSLLCKLC
ncbi:uncharacterized protein BT62DRAFT_916631 [Guyanagaster necrorhizus]|uniref:Uncharacterized protein n=1 Tax=Guyanagaster necrorhizus TaxID=856835 RepID=A0A9P7VZP5_9AGAR|nr:uncharacterized protein BT62DRAFT_916631 [Guyanagaster necrorhizus MCA 3950]KAG7450103.1 hypothetical protein BT62DRAFT_916631 [Guyanagaster necrorhizus MCA 3950]